MLILLVISFGNVINRNKQKQAIATVKSHEGLITDRQSEERVLEGKCNKN